MTKTCDVGCKLDLENLAVQRIMPVTLLFLAPTSCQAFSGRLSDVN